KTIAVQHVPERTARPRLVIADAGIDQDIVVRRFDNKTLNTEHEPALGIDECRLQPRAILVEKLLGQLREKRQRLEEGPLLLDNWVDRDVIKRQRHSHVDTSLEPARRFIAIPPLRRSPGQTSLAFARI